MKLTPKKVCAERRTYPRYNTEMDVYFKIKYDTKMRVEFHVIGARRGINVDRKYFGICRNVGVEGLCIESKKELKRGDNLLIEVYEPMVSDPIKMEGRVRWCEKRSGQGAKRELYGAGVRVVSVGGRSVADSIYFDRKYKVAWGVLLEALFGTFATINKDKGPSKRHKC